MRSSPIGNLYLSMILAVLALFILVIVFMPGEKRVDGPASGLSVRTERGTMGVNLVIENASGTTYRKCKVQLNDRFDLREDTVLDARGQRVYPLLLFVDGAGRSPLAVKITFIQCFDPRVVASFG